MTGKLVLVLAYLVAEASGGAPLLVDLFRVGQLGMVAFSTAADGQIVGRHRGGGACIFPPEAVVVSGSFEGTVFTGTLRLCQVGCGATERAYPFLAVWHGDRMVGKVVLDPGCQSPALDSANTVEIAKVGPERSKRQ